MRGLCRVITSGALLALPLHAVTAPAEPVDFPPRFAAAYFKQPPARKLVDPQRVLSREDFREQLEFLDYHSGDSSIDLYLYILPGNQMLPESLAVEPLIDDLFASGKPAVVVHYFMGRPDRAALYLSPSLDQVVPLADQGRALETAVAQAEQEPIGVRQLSKFTVQLSIQMYWMERMLKEAEAKGEQDGVIEVLPRELLVAEQELSPVDEALKGVVVYVVPVLSGLGALIVLVVARFWLKRRARYRFVDLEVETRLGGPHAAGVGAVMSFATAAVSPASQRER